MLGHSVYYVVCTKLVTKSVKNFSWPRGAMKNVTQVLRAPKTNSESL